MTTASNQTELQIPDKKEPEANTHSWQPSNIQVSPESYKAFHDECDQVAKEREQQWLNKLAKDNFQIAYTQEKVNGKTIIEGDKKLSELTHEQYKKHLANLCTITGSANSAYQDNFLNGVLNGLTQEGNIAVARVYTGTLSAIHSLEPKDVIEAQLISRLMVLHDQYSNYMAFSAIPEQTSEGRNNNINRATKLMRIYNETLDALNRYRRQGEQKVTVTHQHVNVNQGGQAVVAGELNTGGGVNGKK